MTCPAILAGYSRPLTAITSFPDFGNTFTNPGTVVLLNTIKNSQLLIDPNE